MSLTFYFVHSIENALIAIALIYFIVFLTFVLVGKVASGEQSYSQVNKAHLKIFYFFCLSALALIMARREFSWHAFLGFLVGSFIYFSLHFVYLFSLIGLAKKSISINILASIKELERQKASVSTPDLSYYMDKNKIGMGNIRESRLQQMTGLGFAQRRDAQYVITPFGKFVQQVGNLILKIWNQKRL